MLKKILLGTAIAVVFSTASYAQTQSSPPDFFQAWYTDAQNAFNKAANEPCFNWAVSAAINQLENDQHQMMGWIDLANDTLLPPMQGSDLHLSQVSLNAIRAELPVAQSENNQVVAWISALASKRPCMTDKELRTSGLTSEETDQALRMLLGLPSTDTEKDVRQLDKTLKDDPRSDKDLLNGDGKRVEQQTPKTDAKVDTKTDSKVDSKVDSKTDTKTDSRVENNPEHSQRTVTPEKTDAVKQVAHSAPVEHVTEAHQTIGHVATSHMTSVGNLGAMHEMSPMHMGGLGGFGGMRMGGLGGLGGLGGMRMGGMGGMRFGRM